MAQIGDRGVRDQYERELRETLWAKDRKPASWQRGTRLATRIALASAEGPSSGRGQRRTMLHCAKRRDNTQPDWRVRERASERAGSAAPRAALAAAPRPQQRTVGADGCRPAARGLLIVTLVNHPWLLEQHCEEVAELTLTSPR